MHYFEVWVSSPKYHGEEALTYSYDSPLKIGAVVVVPLQRHTVVALISKEVSKPSFKTKSIVRVVSQSLLPPQLTQLIEWMKEYYPAPFGQMMSLLLPTSLIAQARQKDFEHQKHNKPKRLPELTEEQQRTLGSIQKVASNNIMLHGNTGTGKTRVYLEFIQQTLAQNKSVILLTPEIGLTPQLAVACSSAFPGKTVVVHSDLSSAKRRDLWLHVLESHEPLIIIGARSALFSPVRNVGLIVVDEFHETAYKQEQAPHYQASRVAAKLAILHGARLILGSATPPITDHFVFQQKKLPIVRMKTPALSSTPANAQMKVIDLKNREVFRSSPWLADPLLREIELALQKHEQALIFLNRRGTARLILCQVCGWQAICPRCDISLTYHSDTHAMQCHTCGYVQKTPISCPSCSSNDIIFRAIGTKALKAELEKLFPKAVIRRFDSDTSKPERLEHQYEQIRAGHVDILVGTQMLGKGLDLPRLSILGVALADTSLSFPDYTAEERTFQLLTQVIGRVNRGHIPGKIFVQTYHPDSPLLRAALSQDYETFLRLQLAEREKYAFPPFRFMLKLVCGRAQRTTAEKASHQLAEKLRSLSRPIEVIGPSPAFIEKVQDRYRWQVVIKSKKRSELVKIIKDLPTNWSYDIDPTNLL